MANVEEICLSTHPRRKLPVTSRLPRLWEWAQDDKIWNNSACFERGKEIKNGDITKVRNPKENGEFLI